MHDIPPLITDVECGLPRRFNKEKVYAAGFATVWLCEPVQRECYGHLIEAGAGKWIICADTCRGRAGNAAGLSRRSEEHTSELQSLMRISYAVFCLKKKKNRKNKT